MCVGLPKSQQWVVQVLHLAEEFPLVLPSGYKHARSYQKVVNLLFRLTKEPDCMQCWKKILFLALARLFGERDNKIFTKFFYLFSDILCMSFVAAMQAQWQFSNHWISGKSLHYKNSETLFYICSTWIECKKTCLGCSFDEFHWNGWC